MCPLLNRVKDDAVFTSNFNSTDGNLSIATLLIDTTLIDEFR